LAAAEAKLTALRQAKEQADAEREKLAATPCANCTQLQSRVTQLEQRLDATAPAAAPALVVDPPVDTNNTNTNNNEDDDEKTEDDDAAITDDGAAKNDALPTIDEKVEDHDDDDDINTLPLPDTPALTTSVSKQNLAGNLLFIQLCDVARTEFCVTAIVLDDDAQSAESDDDEATTANGSLPTAPDADNAADKKGDNDDDAKKSADEAASPAVPSTTSTTTTDNDDNDNTDLSEFSRFLFLLRGSFQYAEKYLSKLHYVYREKIGRSRGRKGSFAS
jgi:hypothetical protein